MCTNTHEGCERRSLFHREDGGYICGMAREWRTLCNSGRCSREYELRHAYEYIPSTHEIRDQQDWLPSEREWQGDSERYGDGRLEGDSNYFRVANVKAVSAWS